MGTAGAARVDTVALHAIAREYETAASIVDAALRTHLGGLEFGGVTAGRAHVAHGDAVRDGLAGVAAALRQWSRAATEVAVALRAAAENYRDADARAGERVGR